MKITTKKYISIGMAGVLILACWMGMKTKEETVYLEAQPVLAQEDEGKKIIYLTFDDGPSQNTEAVLKILAEADAKATFFVTNEFPAYTNLIREEGKQGHTIGIHTYSHKYEEIYQNSDAYFSDIDKMQEILYEQTGKKSKILRFPGGSSNTISRNYCNGIMSQLTKEVMEKGYAYYDWNATNGDGDTSLDASALIEKAKKEIGSQDVVMLLMHDGAGNEETVKALPKILQYCKEQGYEFCAIDETTPVFHHHVYN